MTVHYTHDALAEADGEIRLMKLNRGCTTSIECELIHANVENLPPYGALSYCWGEDADDRLITCNGKSFPVRVTLESALERLRDGFADGNVEEYLWIDAICIDQRNLGEKSDQIPLMGHIYSNAQTVYIDLGSGGEAPAQIVKGEPSFPFQLRHGGEADHILGLATLEQPWWRRGWVIQEMALARRVKYMYNSLVFNEDEFQKAIDLENKHKAFKPLQWIPSIAVGFLNYDKMLKIKAKKPRNALELLGLTRDFLVREPKDKIYAFMALMTNDDRISIGPYSQSVEIAYQRFAAHQVRSGRCMELLDFAGICRRNMMALIPSWVPEWTAQSSVYRILSTLRPVPYSASLGEPEVEILGDEDVIVDSAADPKRLRLKVRGFRIGKLKHVVDLVVSRKAGEISEALERAHRLLESVSSCYEDPEDAFARTLIIDDTYEGANQLWCSTPITDPAKTFQNAMEYWKSGKTYNTSANWDAPQTLQMQIEAVIFGRAFAVLEDGHFALVPFGMKPGDDIVIFCGGKIPFLLKESSLGGDILMGEAYVQGYMNGEVSQRGFEAEDIILI